MNKKLFCLPLLLAAIQLSAQLGGLGSKLLQKDPVEQLTRKPAISTGINDVVMDGSMDPSFGRDSVYKKLTSLERTPTGGFILKQGMYEFRDQSYCLHAGTYGPGGGDGYMFAPPKGTMDEIVESVVANSVNHPEIPQTNIQLLLWSILAKAKFAELQPNIKLTATTLLTPKQIVKINGGAMGLIPERVKNDAINSAPTGLKEVLIAEAKLRSMLTNPYSTYHEVEAIAVLGGAAPPGPGSKNIPSGQWSLHPDGYYIRYIPQGYSITFIQIFVPRGSAAIGKEYNPSTHIAVPGNTSRQRLMQSGREHL